MVDERVALTTGRLTRAQRLEMVSTWPGTCSACGQKTRLVKAVGTPWRWHKCRHVEAAFARMRKELGYG